MEAPRVALMMCMVNLVAVWRNTKQTDALSAPYWCFEAVTRLVPANGLPYQKRQPSLWR